jgi:DNA-binding response OmpR family regulator
MHILVVEDDAPLAKIVKKSLESGGHTVDVAVDGQEGLDLGRQRSHDAVVLDIQLPKVSGMDVCRRLREDGNRVPIIMLTARSAVADRINGLDAGADDYLPKSSSRVTSSASTCGETGRSPPRTSSTSTSTTCAGSSVPPG